MKTKVLIFAFVLALALLSSCAPASSVPAYKVDYEIQTCDATVSIYDHNDMPIEDMFVPNIDVLVAIVTLEHDDFRSESRYTIAPSGIVDNTSIIRTHMAYEYPTGFSDLFVVRNVVDYKSYNALPINEDNMFSIGELEFEPYIIDSEESSGSMFYWVLQGSRSCKFEITLTSDVTALNENILVTKDILSFNDDQENDLFLEHPDDGIFSLDESNADFFDMADFDLDQRIDVKVNSNGTFALSLGSENYYYLMDILSRLPADIYFEIDEGVEHGFIMLH